jgi:hypothetical protein
MNFKKHIALVLFAMSTFLISCDKGYTVRFTNYSQHPIDSLIIGENTLVFSNVEIQTETEYKPIKKGKYAIECVTKSKNRYFSSITIPSSGSGTRSIQIDGTNTVVVLEQ